MLMVALSFAGMCWVNTGTALVVITAWAVLGRIGMGVALPPLTLGALRGIGKEWISHGASTIIFARHLGGAIGVSLVGVTLEWRLQEHGVNGLPDNSSEHLSQLTAFHEVFLMLAATMGLAMLAGWRVRSKAVNPA